MQNLFRLIYPGGMPMPGRNFSSGNYRFGYNGMEKDDEVKGQGNSYTTEFRHYDTRIVRWLSIDPKSSKMPWQSPYVGMDNNPVIFNDPFGDEVINKYTKERNTLKQKRDDAQVEFGAKFGGITKDQLKLDKGLKKEFKSAKNNLNKLSHQFGKIDEKYQVVEASIKFIKDNFGEVYNEMNSLKIQGQIIDVEIEAHPFKFFAGQSLDPINGSIEDISNGKKRTAVGFTQNPTIKSPLNDEGHKFFKVGIAFKVQTSDGIFNTIYHEFRHIHYKFNSAELNKDEETQVLEDTENAFRKFK